MGAPKGKVFTLVQLPLHWSVPREAGFSELVVTSRVVALDGTLVQICWGSAMGVLSMLPF